VYIYVSAKWQSQEGLPTKCISYLLSMALATDISLWFCLLCEVYAFASVVSRSVAAAAALNLSVLTLLVI
jgi:hypothetical protein